MEDVLLFFSRFTNVDFPKSKSLQIKGVTFGDLIEETATSSGYFKDCTSSLELAKELRCPFSPRPEHLLISGLFTLNTKYSQAAGLSNPGIKRTMVVQDGSYM